VQDEFAVRRAGGAMEQGEGDSAPSQDKDRYA
jgi:hypothetical protein